MTNAPLIFLIAAGAVSAVLVLAICFAVQATGFMVSYAVVVICYFPGDRVFSKKAAAA